MSLVVAVALPKFAVVMSDTRGCLNGVPVSDELRKIYPLPNGTFLQSGPSVGWAAALYRRLQTTDGTLDAMIEAAQEWAPKAMRVLETSDPEIARLVRTTQSSIIVGSSSDVGLVVLEMDWLGRVLTFGPDVSVVAGPSSLADVLPAMQDRLNDFIEAGVEVDTLTLGALIAYAAEFCHDAHQRCSLIGPDVECGMILQPAPGVFGSFFMERTPACRVSAPHDEFSKLTAYRAYVRAKSMRLGREQGLVGAALEARTAEDLRSSIDPETGIATLPEALKYAQVNSMSSPLGRDTFGGGLQTFLQNHVEARFIIPFAKISTNIFRYVWQSSPVLNLLSSQTRAALARGGEEAAIINTRSALAGTMYGFGLYQAMAGNLTGRGPSDPGLRKLWLKNHQPYSFRLGGGSPWISYSRVEPLSMPLGLVADLHTIINELGDKATEASDVAYGTVAALFYNLSSKSYLQGLSEFTSAWASNDPHQVQKWLRNFAGSALVPQAVNSLNPDNVYRDVQSMADAIIERIPGWSKTLDPRFDMFGEPVLKVPGLANRNQIFTARDARFHLVEDDLLSLGRSLSPMSPKLEGGLINLQDRDAFDNGTHVSPYIRMMQLIRDPGNGQPPLRQAMTNLVRSPEWAMSSDGTSLFPGGSRWLRAAGLKTEYEQRALAQVRQEYPKLDLQIRGVARAKGAAIQSGESGVKQVENLFGIKVRQ
jgi:hypothetical protein